MQPARLRADFLRYGGGKGNHVMPHLGFNLMNAFQVKVTALGNGPGGIFRDDPCLGQSQAGGSFHLKPAAKFVFITPNSAHLRARIAWYQRFSSQKSRVNQLL